MDTEAFEQAFIRWVKEAARITQGEVVSIDGKSLRGTREGTQSKRAVHIVSARANSNRLSLGQVKVDEKSNGITAIPKLLEILALQGCIVTIDATGCQKEIASKIVSRGADYILAVKGNQGNLEADMERTVRFCRPAEEWVEEDFGHGRIESRKCSLYRDISFIEPPLNGNI
ncbi:MAG: ISAs1 family transposase [Tannerella sp.]|nr:ISAs1 family transposase [Tannerella sp.]